MQTATPLAASVPLCAPGHKPQFVTHQGAPAGHQLGKPCPSLFHIECHACGKATVPTPNRAMVELRWTREDTAALRIPISHLQRYRRQVLAQLQRDAELATALEASLRAEHSRVLPMTTTRSRTNGRTAHAG